MNPELIDMTMESQDITFVKTMFISLVVELGVTHMKLGNEMMRYEQLQQDVSSLLLAVRAYFPKDWMPDSVLDPQQQQLQAAVRGVLSNLLGGEHE